MLRRPEQRFGDIAICARCPAAQWCCHAGERERGVTNRILCMNMPDQAAPWRRFRTSTVSTPSSQASWPICMTWRRTVHSCKVQGGAARSGPCGLVTSQLYFFTLAQRGAAKILLGKLNEVLIELDCAVSLQPNKAFTLAERVVKGGMLGRINDALADLDQAQSLLPNYAFTLTTRGYVKRLLGQGDAALADFDRAEALLPDAAYTLCRLAKVKVVRGSYEEALQDLAAHTPSSPGTPPSSNSEEPHRSSLLLILRPWRTLKAPTG
jgi:hypothetical protein